MKPPVYDLHISDPRNAAWQHNVRRIRRGFASEELAASCAATLQRITVQSGTACEQDVTFTITRRGAR